MGLNYNFVIIHTQILVVDPFSSVNKAHFLVYQEERQQALVFSNILHFESMPLIVKGG